MGYWREIIGKKIRIITNRCAEPIIEGIVQSIKTYDESGDVYLNIDRKYPIQINVKKIIGMSLTERGKNEI